MKGAKAINYITNYRQEKKKKKDFCIYRLQVLTITTVTLTLYTAQKIINLDDTLISSLFDRLKKKKKLCRDNCV